MKIMKELRKTALNWDNDSDEVIISTSESHIKNKLDRLCTQYPEHYKFRNGDDLYKNYICTNKNLIRFSKPKILTDEQRKEYSERAYKNLHK